MGKFLLRVNLVQDGFGIDLRSQGEQSMIETVFGELGEFESFRVLGYWMSMHIAREQRHSSCYRTALSIERVLACQAHEGMRSIERNFRGRNSHTERAAVKTTNSNIADPRSEQEGRG